MMSNLLYTISKISLAILQIKILPSTIFLNWQLLLENEKNVFDKYWKLFKYFLYWTSYFLKLQFKEKLNNGSKGKVLPFLRYVRPSVMVHHQGVGLSSTESVGPILHLGPTNFSINKKFKNLSDLKNKNMIG